MARKGRIKVIYKGTFISIQTLEADEFESNNNVQNEPNTPGLLNSPKVAPPQGRLPPKLPPQGCPPPEFAPQVASEVAQAVAP